MEPNKLEQDFRHKLEQRTIQPTEMAWDRLDAMLSVTEEKKKKPRRTWMYMAASFLALLLVGTFFLNQEKQNPMNATGTNNAVTTTKSEQGTTIDEAVKPTVITSPTVKEQDAVATTTPSGSGKAAISVKKAPMVSKTEVTKSNIALLISNEAVSATTNNEAVKVKTGPAKISVNAANLLASVDRQAVNDPAMVANTNSVAKKQSVKVDPNSLLTSVEGELNESFRGKVLQSVAKNYNIIKTSVASRNRQ